MSEPADIWNHVSTPTPRLVLSVIGDSYAFVPRAWDHMAFKTAMVDTAKRAGGKLYITINIIITPYGKI